MLACSARLYPQDISYINYGLTTHHFSTIYMQPNKIKNLSIFGAKLNNIIRDDFTPK